MSTIPRTRRLLILSPIVAALIGGTVFLLGAGTPSASDDAAVVATSVCEAHELRAHAAEDPHFKIEIPAEFDQQFPSREACLSHEAASDEEAPGPLQPIEFSHKHHAGTYQIDCQYCHSNTDSSPSAGVPSVELCMGCHAQFSPAYDELQGIQTLQEALGAADAHRVGADPPGSRARAIPAQPPRSSAGVECQACHGPVEELDKLYMTEDTKWWPWGLPTQKLEMGWCVQCHRKEGASQDCSTCHY